MQTPITSTKPVVQTSPAPRAQPHGVTLPAIARSEMPLDQVPAPWTLTASDGSGLLARRVEVRAVVQGPLAFTELHLYFANTEDRTREGTFAITLPPGAAVSRFAMETDGHMMEAEVVEKQVARRAYEDFLHRKQDPALMEKAPGNQFTARVFPIPAKATKHVVISYSQELPGERYVLPLRGLPKVEQLDVALAVTAADGSRVTEKLAKRDWLPEQDFVQQAPVAAEAIAAGDLVIAQVSPFDQATVTADVPKAMTVLVDTSASRALGFARYAGAIRELVTTLSRRYPGLRVEVIAFDQDTRSIYAGPADGFGKTEVDALIARGAAGASDLGQALASLAHPHERVAIVTDGVVTAGPDGAELPAKIKELAARQVARVDVVLAGGIRDQALATSLVTAGLPRTGAVLDLDRQIGDVASGLGERVLTDIEVRVAGASWVYPRTIRSARPNQPAVVYARFADAAPRTIDVQIGNRKRGVGTVGGTPALIARAAAAAEVADLEAKLATGKPEDAKALRAEIVRKAVGARVISNETSMLVLESDGDYARYGIDRRALADILVIGPAGVEQRNRTYVATKHRPHRQVRDREQQFAMKDTTDTAAATPRADSHMRVARSVAGPALEMAKTAEAPSTGREAPSTGREAPSAGREAPSAGREAQEEPDPMPLDDKRIAEVAPAKPEPEPAASPTARPPVVVPAPPRDMPSSETTEPWPPPGSPPPLRGTLAQIDRLLRAKRLEDALAKARAWHDSQPGDVLALIGLGEALEANHDTAQAARIYGSIIDLFPGRADLRRFAGERLERIGDGARSLAVDTYRRAVAERPDHLTGHRLLAYALLRHGQHAEAFAAILKGLEQKYPEDRFAGGVRVLSEDAGLIGAAWLAVAPTRKQEIVTALRKHHAALATGASTRFIMYWETDANDVDFHIQDARGGHAFYSSPELPSGGELYADITTGYGPECFAIKGRPTAGPYKISINYYSQGPMGYGMGLLQIIKHDGKGKLVFQDRPYVIMNDEAYVNLGTYR